MLLSPSSLELRDIVIRIKNQLNTAADNLGIQYKINTRIKWDNTVGLRCNHTDVESLPKLIRCVTTAMTLNQTLPLLEYISISRAYGTDTTTQRKHCKPWRRNVFITFRPPKPLFAELKIRLPYAIENYMELDTLLDALQAIHKESMDG